MKNAHKNNHFTEDCRFEGEPKYEYEYGDDEPLN